MIYFSKQSGGQDYSIGIGILIALFDWTAKYQRSRGGVNSRTSTSDMLEFTLRVGSDWPICRGIRPGVLLYCGVWDEEHWLKGACVCSGTEPESR